jgi:hypothetical protein
MALHGKIDLVRELEREFEEEYFAQGEFEGEFEAEFEEELESPDPSAVAPGTLRSLRFSDEPDLFAVADGRLRLGRVNDSPYPAPIQSQGRAVRKVQQALIDLGYPLPLNGDDGNYGQETYDAVLAYKRQFNILTASGYLDGIVGPKTIAHLDSRFPPGPLPACGVQTPLIVAAAGQQEAGDGAQVPWVTCDPLIEPGPGSICDKKLDKPDSGVVSAEGGGVAVAPAPGDFYCVNQPHIHLEFTAWWDEMLPPDQRPPGQRNRAANAPRYDVTFKAYREENFVPGQKYVRDITVTVPSIGNVHFITSLQRNRIFRVSYSIVESP